MRLKGDVGAAPAKVRPPTDALRGYQRRERRDIERAMQKVVRVLFVAFMGSGKTVVAASLIRTWIAQGARVLVLVHRGEILKQTARKLQSAGVPASSIGYIWAKNAKMNADAPVQLASVQTLIRRDAPEGITRVVIDEAHHVQAGSWRKILSWYTQAKVLGLTATPERLDGKPLREFFDEMVLGETPETLIEDEWLTQPEIWTREDGWRPKGLRKRRGDYAAKAAARAMSDSTIVGGIPRAYLEHARDMPAVGFAATKEQAAGLMAACRQAGIASETLVDSTKEGEREAILGRLKIGETRILWTCDILGEGWDYPGVRCVILARPTASLARYMQWSGRCMRPGGRAVVLDHAGNFYAHGPPWEERDWSLDGRTVPTRCASLIDGDGRVSFLAPVEIDGRLVRADQSMRVVCSVCGLPALPSSVRNAMSRRRAGRRGYAYCAEHARTLARKRSGNRPRLPCAVCGRPSKSESSSDARRGKQAAAYCTLHGKRKRPSDVRIACVGYHGSSCAWERTRHASDGLSPWRCGRCARRHANPLFAQIVCAGWPNACPHAAKPPMGAFAPGQVQARDGEPWRCRSCTSRRTYANNKDRMLAASKRGGDVMRAKRDRAAT